MELNVGDYVRTKNGIERFKKENGNGWFFEKDMIIKPDNIEKYIIKSSPNIIDLIEVGDYVNGRIVDDYIYLDKLGLIGLTELEKEDEKFIKSIVTKEQFEAMKYVVGDTNVKD